MDKQDNHTTYLSLTKYDYKANFQVEWPSLAIGDCYCPLLNTQQSLHYRILKPPYMETFHSNYSAQIPIQVNTVFTLSIVQEKSLRLGTTRTSGLFITLTKQFTSCCRMFK